MLARYSCRQVCSETSLIRITTSLSFIIRLCHCQAIAGSHADAVEWTNCCEDVISATQLSLWPYPLSNETFPSTISSWAKVTRIYLIYAVATYTNAVWSWDFMKCCNCEDPFHLCFYTIGTTETRIRKKSICF